MNHEVDRLAGQRLRQRRVILGMSLNELSQKVGVAYQQLQKYETGANRMSCSRLWDLSQVLDVPISYFFDGIDSTDHEVPPDPDATAAMRESERFAALVAAMPQAHRNKLRALVMDIAKLPD